MTGQIRSLLLGILLLLVSFPAPAQTEQEQPVDFSWNLFRVEEDAAQEDLLLVVWIVPEQGWYTYSHVPGEAGKPTEARARLLVQNRELPVLYPPGESKPDPFDPAVEASVYEGRTPLFIPVENPPQAEFHAQISVSLLLCSDVSCFPVTRDIGVQTETLAGLPSAENQPWWETYLAASTPEQPLPVPPGDDLQEAPVRERDFELPSLKPRYFLPGLEVTGLGKAVLLALLAGLILNVMPCVLPVLTLKLRALFPAQGKGPEQERHFRLHNIFFSLGIVSFFLVLALLAVFAGMAWGQLFQHETALMALAAVVFLFGLSLLNVFNLPVIEMQMQGTRTSRTISVEAFFTGLLATLLATPCSGPLLGGVLAWSLFQRPVIVGVVFLSIGVGMALPYIAAALFPSTVKYIPRPGKWMARLEQIFGFLLLGTCIYLIALLPQARVIKALVLLWFAGLAALIWGKWTSLSQSGKKRWSLRGVSLLLLLIGFLLASQTPRLNVATWTRFEPDRFVQQLGKERMVVEFTADWCPNCKILEKTVLNAKNMGDWREQHGFIPVQVDMTREDPAARDLLFALGSQSIPVVALFPEGDASARPLVLRDLFTESQMEKALEETFGRD